MEAVAEHLARGGAAFGVLMCGTSVHGFYQRLGWRDVTNKIVFIDPAGQRSPYPEGPDHFVMILGGARPAGDWPRGLIDFNGEDW
jgi:hypothetical protein